MLSGLVAAWTDYAGQMQDDHHHHDRHDRHDEGMGLPRRFRFLRMGLEPGVSVVVGVPRKLGHI
jgi:hypothetical protein